MKKAERDAFHEGIWNQLVEGMGDRLQVHTITKQEIVEWYEANAEWLREMDEEDARLWQEQCCRWKEWEMEHYNPFKHSLVQAMQPNRMASYEVSDFHKALLFSIMQEISRVHWNNYQHKWEEQKDGDPMIPGIHWRSYRGGCDCEDDEDHQDNCIQNTPNFRFEDVEFNWYKYPGRGMSTNASMSASDWEAWHARCLAKIREYDSVGWEVSQEERERRRQIWKDAEHIGRNDL